METISKSSYILRSIAGLFIACVVFALVLFVANAFLYFLNLLRGTESHWFETAFRELAAPAAGSYAAMIAVQKTVTFYNRNFVFFGFSTLLVIVIGVSLIMMLMVWRSGRFSIYDLVMQFLTAPVCIATAYFTYKHKMGVSQ